MKVLALAIASTLDAHRKYLRFLCKFVIYLSTTYN